MKARIFNNEFSGVYSQKWLDENSSLFIGGELVSSWVLTTKLPSKELKNPVWVDGYWVEKNLTIEEIMEQSLEMETERYIQRTRDGISAYAKISAEFRLAKLSGQISEQTHGDIENLLIPVRNEVLAGQWISGLQKLQAIGAAQVGQELYDRLLSQLSDYITENY